MLRAEPQATIASRTDPLMQNRQRNVGQSKLSKVIFVATNASRENNKVRASERRQPLTVEQMVSGARTIRKSDI